MSAVERALARLLRAHRIDRLDRAGPGAWTLRCTCMDPRGERAHVAGTALDAVRWWQAHLEQTARAGAPQGAADPPPPGPGVLLEVLARHAARTAAP